MRLYIHSHTHKHATTPTMDYILSVDGLETGCNSTHAILVTPEVTYAPHETCMNMRARLNLCAKDVGMQLKKWQLVATMTVWLVMIAVTTVIAARNLVSTPAMTVVKRSKWKKMRTIPQCAWSLHSRWRVAAVKKRWVHFTTTYISPYRLLQTVSFMW